MKLKNLTSAAITFRLPDGTMQSVAAGAQTADFPANAEYAVAIKKALSKSSVQMILTEDEASFLVGMGVDFSGYEDIATLAETLEPKELVGVLSQSGTAAPTLVSQKNTIGAIVWARSNTGIYTGTLTGAFPSGKVNVKAILSSADKALTVVRTDANVLTFNIRTITGSPAASDVFDAFIEITVFP